MLDRYRNIFMSKCSLSKVKMQIKNWKKIFTKDINRWFPQNGFRIALKYVKTGSTLHIIREMKTKTTLSFAIILE